MISRSSILVVFVLSIVLGSIENGEARAAEPADPSGCLLWISDIHFDPFAGGEVIKLANDEQTGWRDHTEWGPILNKMPRNAVCSPTKNDANDFLFLKVIDGAAAQLIRKPDCILLTGDFLSHGFDAAYFSKNHLPTSLTTVTLFNQFVDQTLAYLAMTVSKKFPGVPVIATLGNNDAYCGDYGVRGNSGFLTTTRQTFQKYFLPNLSNDFVTYGGCYSTTIPGTNHKFVVLNSIPFISDYPETWSIAGIPPLISTCDPLRSVDLVDEFDWLTRTIDACADDQQAWVTCHIPPRVNCYDGTQSWPRLVPDGKGADQIPFVNEFSDFYLSHRQHFAGVLTGHSHEAEFKLIRDNKSIDPVSFVLMAPSIGRNHGNNASFRHVRFNRATLAIEDYTTHWLDGSQSPPDWGTPFKFTATYGQPDVSPASLLSVFNGMKSGAKAPTGKTFLDQYFYDYSTRTGAKNSTPRTHYKQALGSILGP
jgi:hypothetical protein